MYYSVNYNYLKHHSLAWGRPESPGRCRTPQVLAPAGCSLPPWLLALLPSTSAIVLHSSLGYQDTAVEQYCLLCAHGYPGKYLPNEISFLDKLLFHENSFFKHNKYNLKAIEVVYLTSLIYYLVL